MNAEEESAWESSILTDVVAIRFLAGAPFSSAGMDERAAAGKVVLGVQISRSGISLQDLSGVHHVNSRRAPEWGTC